MATSSQAPAGGPATAVATANFGGGGLIPIQAGQTASKAGMSAGGRNAFGAMSGGYGGSGEALAHTAEADFGFTTTAPEDFSLKLLSNNHTGLGFDDLTLQIDINGKNYLTFSTQSLGFAENFFTNNTLDFGILAARDQTVDVRYSLSYDVATLRGFGDGFGFTYSFGTPEPSTWAMMLLGFAGLGFAGYRRAKTA